VQLVLVADNLVGGEQKPLDIIVDQLDLLFCLLVFIVSLCLISGFKSSALAKLDAHLAILVYYHLLKGF